MASSDDCGTLRIARHVYAGHQIDLPTELYERFPVGSNIELVVRPDGVVMIEAFELPAAVREALERADLGDPSLDADPEIAVAPMRQSRRAS